MVSTMKSKPKAARDPRLSPADLRRLLGPMNLRAVAKATGLHHNTLCRFMAAKHEPRDTTLEALRKYLSKWAGGVDG